MDLEKIPGEKESASYSIEEIDPEAEKRLVRRLDRRIVPSSMIIYLLCFLDRSNIGNAKVLNSDTGDSLQQTTRTSNADFNTALMVFLVAYVIFETPSNYMLKKFRPSRWIALLMLGWGAMTLCLGTVHTFAQLTAIRFLLGMFEAGLFPGLVYFLTFWYKPNERAVRVALILACATLAGAFGGAIAFGVGKMNGVHGLQAWRWLFLIEGAPSCACAFLVFFLFPDYPETAHWLNPEEKEVAVGRLKGVASLGHDKVTWQQAKETLTDWRLYVHYMVYVCISVPFSSISLFTPTIVSGLGYRGLDAQLFTVPPYAVAFVITVLVSWLSDRYEARSIGSAASLFIAGVCFVVEGALEPREFKARYGVLCVAVSFSFASIPPLLSWLTANLKTTAATTLAVPMNVSFGGVGQIIGVYIYKANESPGYPTGHFTNAGFALFGSLLAVGLRVMYQRWNERLAIEERRWRL
ncbi:mfs [Moniliophthora roreri MCA 2997]|uniref:Mfs n=2 Tax=Moniliophthora roreri TaxID=221103 RepID=V2WAC9_MONRO|nr:mfs [Moniliophthora roreri MCA 2997]KAI3616991.1 mfs [Moniliophthora roreri]